MKVFFVFLPIFFLLALAPSESFGGHTMGLSPKDSTESKAHKIFLYPTGAFVMPGAYTDHTGLHLSKPTFPKQRGRYEFKYLELGGGMALWQTSHEPLMENERKALHFYLDYGDLQKPLVFGGGVNLRTAFLQEGYRLQPQHHFVYLKYVPTRLFYEWPVWLNLYGLAGPSFWTADLVNSGYPNFASYEGALETDSGLGFITGLGVSADWLNFSLSAQFAYFYGKGQYFDGGLVRQDVHTGSAQFQILLGYRFFLNGNPFVCPTYR